MTKALKTTLGLESGEAARPITKQDLLVFNRNIQALQGKVEKGVTAVEVISMSTEADKKRCKEQIHMAVPGFMKAGDVHFITNAGPKSKADRKRHNVHIILSDYEKGLAKGTPLQAAKEIARGNIKLDCDCEHHTFTFRYIATLMGANAGRAETGFPKQRNPSLEGIACKHVLRVMIELSTSIFIWKKIAAMIEADRQKNASKATRSRQKSVQLTPSEVTELAGKQDKNRRAIKPIEDRAAAKARAEMTEKIKNAPPPKKIKPASKSIEKAAQLLAREFNMTPEQVLAGLKDRQ
ncbi:hypothetical protein [Methylomicrobium agile]|uniref:hypothetical protein n=1 Tax=Methylomicrobium agile TaxID=39774 RepID=UPI0012F6D40D|nr:hypothetical protein [Methylomicrobium agile]